MLSFSLSLLGLLIIFQSISPLLPAVASSPIEGERTKPTIKPIRKLPTTTPQQLSLDSEKPNSKRCSNDRKNSLGAIFKSDGTSSLTGRLQRFLQLGHTNRRVVQTKERSLRAPSNGIRQCRTKITLRRPTSSSAWNHLYGGDDGRLNRDKNNLEMSVEYNHADVGITNPSIKSLSLEENDCTDDNNISINYHPNRREIVASEGSTDIIIMSANKEVTSQEDYEFWWPSSSYGSENHHLHKDLRSRQNTLSDGWRIRRYARRVGKGNECYERARNAALDWEFHKDSDKDISSCKEDRGKNSMGIVQAIPPNPQENDSKSRNRNGPFADFPQNANTNVVQIWSSPGKRKLATYTEFGKTRFCLRLPSLHVLNPVAVVYDLIDQRGPGTIYSSTAYGTLGGHWLRGEERVTVAMRNCDGGLHSNFDGHTNDGGYVDVEILSYSRPSASLMGRLVWPMIGKMQNAFFLNQLDFLEKIAQEHD